MNGIDTLVDNAGDILGGFATTLWLLVLSLVVATVLGTVLASFRVAPVAALRFLGATYVNLVRNTPLVLVLALAIFVLPVLGFRVDGFQVGPTRIDTFLLVAALGLSFYTAAFVCEAVRSGINSVPPGQAEAARSVGMTFGQVLRLVVLPQAFRAVLPPLTSTYIALAKNTSVVAVFGVAEAAYYMRKLGNQYADDLWAIFIGMGLGYVAIVAVIAGAASLLERRLEVAR